MAEIITMPRLSDTMEEGTIAKWHKSLGDKISEGDILAEIQTDKAVQEFESDRDGFLLHIGIKEEESAKVDSILAIIGEKDEDIKDLISGKQVIAEQPKENQERNLDTQKTTISNKETFLEKSSQGRIFASPLAKKVAKEKNIELSNIKGSGPNGRIVKKDLEQGDKSSGLQGQISLEEEKHIGLSSRASSIVQKEDQVILHSPMRKMIAKRLSQSKSTAPHYYLMMDIDMQKAKDLREQINKVEGVKISFNDLIIKASALALRSHPKLNVSWKEEEMIYHSAIHIGVAVAITDGLVVPVVLNADQKTLNEISYEVKEKALKAKENKLAPNDIQGSTFTISNLGMFEIESFTSIINPPNACILSVGAIIEKPIVREGKIEVGHIMKLSLACDHRAVDGATGASYLKSLKGMLENPMSILI